MQKHNKHCPERKRVVLILRKQLIPLLLLLLVLPRTAARAEETGPAAMILYEPRTGTVLEALHPDEPMLIASTTKIMTAMVALEHCALNEPVTVTEEQTLVEGSSAYLQPGATYTVEDLLYGLMLNSGNDAACALAEHTAGSIEAFAELMNEKVAALGLQNTHFANPHGLNDPEHYSSARDLALITAAAMENPVFCTIFGARSYSSNGIEYVNHNKLLDTCEGCIGGKTGYTGSAGRTLVTCAERDGLRLVAVTLHDGSDWADHTALYEYGFEHYHSRIPIRRGEVLAECAVRGGESVSVPLAAEQAFSCAVAEGEELTIHIETPETARAPVTAGQRLGEVTILLGDTELGRVGLTARHGVSAAPLSEKTTFLDKLRALFGA